MNKSMSRARYESLPDRQTFQGTPRYLEVFRDSAYTGMLFVWIGPVYWDAYRVELDEQ